MSGTWEQTVSILKNVQTVDVRSTRYAMAGSVITGRVFFFSASVFEVVDDPGGEGEGDDDVSLIMP